MPRRPRGRPPGSKKKKTGEHTQPTDTAEDAPSPIAAPEPKRELPLDPAARAAVLGPFASSADFLLAIADSVASRLPPERPLSAEEKAAIREPLIEVLWKYDGNMPCELALATAVGMVALPRWMEARAIAAGTAAPAPRAIAPVATPAEVAA